MKHIIVSDLEAVKIMAAVNATIRETEKALKQGLFPDKEAAKNMIESFKILRDKLVRISGVNPAFRPIKGDDFFIDDKGEFIPKKK